MEIYFLAFSLQIFLLKSPGSEQVCVTVQDSGASWDCRGQAKGKVMDLWNGVIFLLPSCRKSLEAQM